jgi:transglutaminase-like putative cysteine protease
VRAEYRTLRQLTVHHRTTYRYRRPVKFGPHRLMFRPRDSHDLRLLDATILITPQAELRWLHDVFGNSVAVAEFEQPRDTLTFVSQILIERHFSRTLEFPIETFAKVIPFSYPASEVPDLGRTIERHYSDPDRLVTDWTRGFLATTGGTTSTEDFLLSLTTGIRETFLYELRHEPGVQSPVETLQRKAGSCRDFAVLMMEAVRSVGLAARFVSGYLYDPAIDGQEGEIIGAGSTHAWVQVYLPGAGWLQFDPTNGSCDAANLVPVAVAREPAQAAPVSGTFDGSSEDFIEMAVEVSVRAARVLHEVA